MDKKKKLKSSVESEVFFACELHENFSLRFLVPVRDAVRPKLVFIHDADVTEGKPRFR